jgi:hypothetical protein
MSTEAQTKKFQKGERVIPSATDKALKYYPAEDEQVMKKVRQHHQCARKRDGTPNERMRPPGISKLEIDSRCAHMLNV